MTSKTMGEIKQPLCDTFNPMKFPSGEFTIAELMEINKNLQGQDHKAVIPTGYYELEPN